MTERGRRRYRRRFILKQFPKNSIGVEIGVFRGEFSSKILEEVQPTQLHLVDPWTYDEKVLPKGMVVHDQNDVDRIFQGVKERFRSQMENGQIVVHRMTSEAASTIFADASLDWVYIDGNHEYEFVLQDLRLYVPKIKPGGMIAGDDYRDDKYGVKRAVDEFVSDNDVECHLRQDTQFLLSKR